LKPNVVSSSLSLTFNEKLAKNSTQLLAFIELMQMPWATTAASVTGAATTAATIASRRFA
jgi:hypothetical protein